MEERAHNLDGGPLDTDPNTAPPTQEPTREQPRTERTQEPTRAIAPQPAELPRAAGGGAGGVVAMVVLWEERALDPPPAAEPEVVLPEAALAEPEAALPEPKPAVVEPEEALAKSEAPLAEPETLAEPEEVSVELEPAPAVPEETRSELENASPDPPLDLPSPETTLRHEPTHADPIVPAAEPAPAEPVGLATSIEPEPAAPAPPPAEALQPPGPSPVTPPVRPGIASIAAHHPLEQLPRQPLPEIWSTEAAPSRPLPKALPRPSVDTWHAARRYLRLTLFLAAGGALALAGLVLVLVVLYRWVDPPTSALMLGQRIGGTSITQRWVPLARISPNLHLAVIMSEDARFCRHAGVDWGELQEAIESAGDGTARGGSTISMQLVKNLFLWPSRSYVRKAIEIPLAYVIEVAWSKQRILEIYLNIAEWGPGVFGAEAAARYHFRKPASLLSPREAALLAVSLPNPFERQAGRPGPGTMRLADNLLVRMRAAQGNAACVRTRAADR